MLRKDPLERGLDRVEKGSIFLIVTLMKQALDRFEASHHPDEQRSVDNYGSDSRFHRSKARSTYLTKVNFPPDTPSSTVLAPGPPVDELPGRNR